MINTHPIEKMLKYTSSKFYQEPTKDTVPAETVMKPSTTPMLGNSWGKTLIKASKY
jgi:hypothetical protein